MESAVLEELNKRPLESDIARAKKKKNDKLVNITTVHKYKYTNTLYTNPIVEFIYLLLRRLKSKCLSESTSLLNCLNSYVKHQLHSDQTARDKFLSKMRTQLEAQIQFKLLNLDSQSNCSTSDSTVISPSELLSLLRCKHVFTYLHQIEHFSKEKRILQTKGRLPKNDHLNKLRPYILVES